MISNSASPSNHPQAMKKTLTVLYSTLCLLHSTLLFVIPTLGGISSAFAQGSADSIRITHTQEAGTLEKQRFIDRYDYVFMTKEPTKWMLKGYTNTSNLFISNHFLFNQIFKIFLDWRIGAEYKITPSFSIGINLAHNKEAPFGGNQLNYSIFFPDRSPIQNTWVGSTQLRWYYDMARRIKEGKSSNNFSGNYIALHYEKAWHNEAFEINGFTKWSSQPGYTDYFSRYYDSQISLQYGVQRRFFRHGLIDFTTSLNYDFHQQIHQTTTFLDGNNANFNPDNTKSSTDYTSKGQWSLNTNLKLGFALADFKERTKAPMCDVFRCYEATKNQWKIEWPRIRLSPSSQSFSSSIGYETKITNSSFSLNSALNFSVTNIAKQDVRIYNSMASTPQYIYDYSGLSINSLLIIQPRWYFLMKRQVQRGKAGNNLSGVYAGFSNIIEGNYGKYKNSQEISYYRFRPRFVCSSLALGYQQNVFTNGFFDVGISKSFIENRSRHPYFSTLNLDLRLGFAF